MTKTRFSLFFLCFALPLPSIGWAASSSDSFIVHFAPGGRFSATTPIVSHWLRPNVAVVRPVAQRLAGQGATLENEMAAWRELPGVQLVERDAPGRFDTLTDIAEPNDPLYSQEFWLDLVGARGLWGVGMGAGVTVAVVDSGVDLRHPDLQANLVAGYDFADRNDQPQDRIGHGTAVAGLLAAIANNNVGIAGLAPSVKLIPLKTSPETGAYAGQPMSSAVAEAIDYAVAHGANIINLSLTITDETEIVKQAIQHAQDQGLLVVAAAGNEGSAVAFPANMPGVIAVANTQSDGSLTSSSNRGSEIAIAAPGVLPQTTLLNSRYGAYGSGTSFSAPMVSAAFAVLHGANPNLSWATLLSLLQATAKPVQGYAFGVMQAGQAAAMVVPDLKLDKTNASLSVTYRLPPTGSGMDIYVAVDTPSGSFSLHPDGGWQSIMTSGYAPLVTNYTTTGATGTLFGNGGIFPPIALTGLPSGAYNWRIALYDGMLQRLIGPVVVTPLEITH